MRPLIVLSALLALNSCASLTPLTRDEYERRHQELTDQVTELRHSREEADQRLQKRMQMTGEIEREIAERMKKLDRSMRELRESWRRAQELRDEQPTQP